MKELTNSGEGGCFLSPDQITALYLKAKGLCSDHDFITSKDLVSETYLRVHEKLDLVLAQPEEIRFSYVLSVMKNQYSNLVRRQKKIVNSFESVEHTVLCDNVEHAIWKKDQFELVERTIKSVSDERTATIILLHLKGLTFKEIAAEMKTVTKENAKTIYNRNIGKVMKSCKSVCSEKDIGN